MKLYIAAVLAFVQFCYKPTVGLENLIHYGFVIQSSSHGNPHGIFDANRTIDGNKNQNWYGYSCGHTADGHTNAWWRLDIGMLATIHRVVIYYRSGHESRLNGFYIFISDTFNPHHPKNGITCFHDSLDEVNPNITQNITCNMVGQYVVIYNERNASDAYLELCEVEVFGCVLKTYGNTCEYLCSPHCTNETCHVVTGECTCKSGYKGRHCRQACGKGTYGLDCNNTCSNCVNESCDLSDGACTTINLCKPGYLGPKCDQVCTKGTYGLKCTENCRNCELEDCSPVDGICQIGCKPGWKDLMCNTVCNKGTYGMNCTGNCRNCESEDCNPVDGTCRNGCKPDWKDSMCNAVCNKGTYGMNCTGNCRICESEDCNPVDGICRNGCKPGWTDSMCNTVCTTGTYGLNCRKNCSNCESDYCDPVDGICMNGCKPGWKDSMCETVSQQESIKGVSIEVFGICISFVMILAVLTVMGVCCYFRRKISQSTRLYEDIRLNAGQRTNEDQVYSEIDPASC